MRWIALVSLLAGCDYLFNLDHIEPRDPATVDANVGMLLDAGPCTDGTLYGKYGPGGTGLLQVCVPDVHLSTLTLNTNVDTDADCDAKVEIDSVHTTVCIRYATSVTLSGSIGTRGPNPLVVVATETLTVRGLVDLASRHAGTPGAGNNWSGCNTLDGRDDLASGGGGGPGATFGSRGGAGGAGGGDPTMRPAPQVSPLDRVRGGCAGGAGGTGTQGATSGAGGGGGGALYLIAGSALHLESTATINASGGGGEPGAGLQSMSGGGAGGGGGGSGGLVGLDAPTVQIDDGARIFANGGGGAGGGGVGAGTAGADPTAPSLAVPAQGGLGASNGGNGGTGAAGDVDATAGASSKSGGGGGGGAGYIVVATAGSLACPACSPTPIAAPP